jgi:Holliday junction resolvase RusA-like endonuclease
MNTAPAFDPFGNELFPEPEPERPAVLRASESWPPPNAELALSFMAFGEMKGAGSKQAWAPENKNVKRTDGKPEPFYFFKNKRWQILVKVRDDSGSGGTRWRKDVQSAARAIWGEASPIAGTALAMELTFVMEEPSTHFGQGRNAATRKPSSPAVPIVRPDLLKLGRAVEDALTEVLYDDDSRIVDQRQRKVYVRNGEAEHVEVRIWRLPTTEAEHQALADDTPALFD